MIGNKFVVKVQLMQTKVEILKLKADSYNWQSHVPKDVQEQLEKTLADIEHDLKCLEDPLND